MKIRLAKNSDVKLIFEWINDPLVRKVSFNSSLIPYDNHEKWFYSKIKEPTTTYHIAEINNEALGQIRYDLQESEYIISILIAPNFRGMGFSSKMLKTSLEEFFKLYKNNI